MKCSFRRKGDDGKQICFCIYVGHFDPFGNGDTLSGEERMRPGLWEVSMTTDGKSGSIGNTCYTPAMVEMANMPAAKLREFTETVSAKRGCTVKEFSVERNKISMVKACPVVSRRLPALTAEMHLKPWINDQGRCHEGDPDEGPASGRM